ncbi:unnamed protein product, partial [Rangifer tarandus platyrhynchus]
RRRTVIGMAWQREWKCRLMLGEMHAKERQKRADLVSLCHGKEAKRQQGCEHMHHKAQSSRVLGWDGAAGGVPGGHRGRRNQLRAVETPKRAQPAEDGLRPLEDPVGPACRPSRDSPVQTRSREKRQAARRGARPARPFQHAQPASGPNERWQRPLCQRE